MATLYTVPGIYRKADSGQNTRVRIVCVNGKLTIETIANPTTPGSCDKARALMEKALNLEGQVESATSRHPVEEKMMAPAEEPVQEQQIQQAPNQKL